MQRPRCWGRRWASVSPTAVKPSTGTAITCGPSTAIYHAGGIRPAVENGSINSGIFYECIKNDVPFVLAGSLRDDGPLPDTVTDMNEAQDAYAAQLAGAGLVVCLGSMLHSIATGNMMPSVGQADLR